MVVISPLNFSFICVKCCVLSTGEYVTRTKSETLKTLVKPDDLDWDQWLSQAMHVHNCTVHTSTKQEPLTSVFGYKFELPANLKRKPAPLYNFGDYA